MVVICRDVFAEDQDLLFKWRNLPEIYNLGSEKRQVSFTEHSEWFDKILINTCDIYRIIEIDSVPVGHIRFEKDDSNTYYVTIYLVGGTKHKGVGTAVLNSEMRNLPNKAVIIAQVLRDNYNSQRFFIKNGFELIETDAKIVSLRRINNVSTNLGK